MVQVSAEEAETQLQDLIKKAIGGETIVITQNGRQVIQLVPIMQPGTQPQFGSARGMLTIADDFDAPLEGLEEYVP